MVVQPAEEGQLRSSTKGRTDEEDDEDNEKCHFPSADLFHTNGFAVQPDQKEFYDSVSQQYHTSDGRLLKIIQPLIQTRRLSAEECWPQRRLSQASSPDKVKLQPDSTPQSQVRSSGRNRNRSVLSYAEAQNIDFLFRSIRPIKKKAVRLKSGSSKSTKAPIKTKDKKQPLSKMPIASVTKTSASANKKKKKKKKKGVKKATKLPALEGYSRLTEQELESARLSGCLCKVCGKKMSSVSSLNAHFTTVHGQRPFSCNLCNKSFKRRDHLRNHQSSTHMIITSLDCLPCGISFKNKMKYLKHMRSQHPERFPPALKTMKKCRLPATKNDQPDQPLMGCKKRGRPRKKPLPGYRLNFKGKRSRQCRECGRHFPQMSALKYHLRLNHWLSECSLCCSQFEGSIALSLHVDQQHKIRLADGSYRFQCVHCTGLFAKDHSLSAHMKAYHRKEQCLACGSCMLGSLSMQEHILSHHPPKTLLSHLQQLCECAMCGLTFPEAGDAERHFLSQHVIRHLGRHDRSASPEPSSRLWWPWFRLYPDLDIDKDLVMFMHCQDKATSDGGTSESPLMMVKDEITDECSSSSSSCHSSQVIEILYQCELCDQLFADGEELEEHLNCEHHATSCDALHLEQVDWPWMGETDEWLSCPAPIAHLLPLSVESDHQSG